MTHVEKVQKGIMLKLKDSQTKREYKIWIDIDITVYGDSLELTIGD